MILHVDTSRIAIERETFLAVSHGHLKIKDGYYFLSSEIHQSGKPTFVCPLRIAPVEYKLVTRKFLGFWIKKEKILVNKSFEDMKGYAKFADYQNVVDEINKQLEGF